MNPESFRLSTQMPDFQENQKFSGAPLSTINVAFIPGFSLPDSFSIPSNSAPLHVAHLITPSGESTAVKRSLISSFKDDP